MWVPGLSLIEYEPSIPVPTTTTPFVTNAPTMGSLDSFKTFPCTVWLFAIVLESTINPIDRIQVKREARMGPNNNTFFVFRRRKQNNARRAQRLRDDGSLISALSKESTKRVPAGTTPIAGATVPEGCEATWQALKTNQSLSWKQLMRRTSLPKDDLKRQLFTLEIRGWIRRVPGRAYVRC